MHKHYGPGSHPSGSPQSAHAGKRRKKEGTFGNPRAVVSEEVIEQQERAVNNPGIVTFADGSKGIYKLSEDLRYGSSVGEILSYEISEALGWNIVPETIDYKREGKPGTLQEFKAGHVEGTEGDTVYFESPAIVTFDRIVGNLDREDGANILRGSDGRFWAIDNNGAFGFEWGGKQTYYEVGNFATHLDDTLSWFTWEKELIDPKQATQAIQEYNRLFGDVAKFAKSKEFGAVTSKIASKVDRATAAQFADNIRAIAKLGKSSDWQSIVKSWEETV